MDAAIENNTATARRSSHEFVVVTLESHRLPGAKRDQRVEGFVGQSILKDKACCSCKKKKKKNIPGFFCAFDVT